MQIVNDGREKTLDGGQVAALGRDLKIHLGDLDDSSVCLDELAVEIGLGGYVTGVDGASDGDGIGLLQLVRSVSAVGAVKGHDDDFTEVGNASK